MTLGRIFAACPATRRGWGDANKAQACADGEGLSSHRMEEAAHSALAPVPAASMVACREGAEMSNSKSAAMMVTSWLAKPIQESQFVCKDSDFDPWGDLGMYGAYSSEFDDLAIAVLEDLQNNTHQCRGLAAEMFREILCFKWLCDYGTSPRTCFPTPEFRPMLPELIEKWKASRAASWGDE